MRTLLVGINAKYIHTNLAIRYLYTNTKDDYNIKFIEFTIKDTKKHIVNEILKFKPTLVGFSCYIWNIEIIKELIKTIKQQQPSIKILLGGPEVSYDIEYWFQALPIDYIISQEGVYPFKQLLKALKEHQSLKTIPQLHYRHNEDFYTNHTQYMIDFNDLKSPYRIKEDRNKLKNKIQYIESSRGCPYQCSYCLASLDNKVRFFDKDFIKQELLYLMNHGAKVFKFLDRTFNIRKDYALDLFDFIIKNHKKDCVFQFEITGDLLDEEIINYLNEHAPPHLFRFEIGIQSTNDQTNELVLRKQDFKKLKHNILSIQNGQKIDLHLDLIAGLPKENYQSFIKTFNDVFALKPHELQLGFLKMLRGTKIRNEAKLYGYQFHDKAPYEIKSHRDLTKEEITKIHAAEEMLERYYNDHRFDCTINYIINTYYQNNNYQFFEDFGVFFKKHFKLHGYQLHDLCTRLLEFLNNQKINTTHVNSLLIYDYLKSAKTRPKIWFEKQISKKEKHTLFHYIIKTYQKYDLDLLFRYGFIEKLTLHPQTYKIGTYYLLKLFASSNQDVLIFEK